MMLQVLTLSALIACAYAAVSYSFGGLESKDVKILEFYIVTFSAIIACACAGLSYSIGGLGGSGGLGESKSFKVVKYYTIPKYEYKYEVHDPKTGDVKEQKEERYGDKVKGEYSLKEPDGTIRVVKYEADKENGFNAKVERKGHALHPFIYKKD